MEEKLNKNFKYYSIIIFSLFFILFTTENFNLEQSKTFGASDGHDYYKIAQDAPQISKGLQFIKSERFFFPYLIGIISKTFNFDIFSSFKTLSILLSFSLIFLLDRALVIIKCPKNYRLTAILLVIFNPYILRYYISLPTLITDLIFLNISLLIVIGLHSSKRYYFFGIAIGMLVRQNTLAFLISTYFLYTLGYFYGQFKKIFLINDLYIVTAIVLFIYLFNFLYASKSETSVSASDLYFVTIFGLFATQYNLNSLPAFFIFPLLSFGPILYFFFINRKNIINFLNPISVFILLSASILILQPLLGGPLITGKNFIRLANYAYPILLVVLPLLLNNNFIFISKTKKYFYFIFLIFWSMHPTFSTIKIFNLLKFSM